MSGGQLFGIGAAITLLTGRNVRYRGGQRTERDYTTALTPKEQHFLDLLAARLPEAAIVHAGSRKRSACDLTAWMG